VAESNHGRPRATGDGLAARTHHKVTWRLMPFLFCCYVLAYLDRVNVGFAKLQMQADLGLSDTVYGIGAGMFFVAYFLFEVPSNLLMRRVGARIWIARIMIVWGLVSMASMFTWNRGSFYTLRFLLGIAEAGFFPGIIWYLTLWYTRAHRAQVVAMFMTAIALSGVIGGPVSGWILQSMDGVAGLRGWHWLYLLEGFPSVVVGLVALRYLDDGPATAPWLTPDERAHVERELAEEDALKRAHPDTAHGVADAFLSWRVWACGVIYFSAVMGNYGLTFWMPQIISETISPDPVHVGLVSMIPWGAAAITMVLVGRHSDRTGERRWHITLSAGVGAVFFFLSGWPGLSGWTGVALLTIALSGTLSAMASFWALPTAMLSGSGAAAGIAWINSIGNLSGYAAPFLLGAVRDATRDATHPNGNMFLALSVLAVSLLIAGLVTLAVRGGSEDTRADPDPDLDPKALQFRA
jgi:sugar phosphate permease